MTTDSEGMTPENAKALRAPFRPEQIGKLPRGQITLDYVGHADVTHRLLEVDPAWTWEPLALTEEGLPAYDRGGGLWIRLTVCGMTRLGYGDGPDPKQRIGDAIRNAAMRFGVALDMWRKGGDLHDDYTAGRETMARKYDESPYGDSAPDGQTHGKGALPAETAAQPETPLPPRPGKTPDEWREAILSAADRKSVVHALRDLSQDGLADAEVADENGEAVTLTALAQARMKVTA